MAGPTKRRYRHPKATVGFREPARGDDHNFSDVDRALHKWLVAHDPEYRKQKYLTNQREDESNGVPPA
jgi:hypothetical protein